MNTFLTYVKPDESPGFLLWQVTHKWQRRLNHVLKHYDLTHMQFVLLATIAWLDHQKESISQVKLSERTLIHTMQVSQVLKTLEHKKYITRKPSPQDPRANLISITREGFQKAKLAIHIVEKADKEFFDLTKSEEQTFIKILAKLSKQD